MRCEFVVDLEDEFVVDDGDVDAGTGGAGMACDVGHRFADDRDQVIQHGVRDDGVNRAGEADGRVEAERGGRLRAKSEQLGPDRPGLRSERSPELEEQTLRTLARSGSVGSDIPTTSFI